MDTLPPSEPFSRAGGPQGLRPDVTQAPANAEPEPPATRGVRRLAAVGDVVGPYRVVRELARGGMGAVYVAEHTGMKRQVALKLMLPGGDRSRVQRFLAEARAAAALRHPNIVTVHDVGEDAGRHYLAMDLIDGESLRARVGRQGPLDPHEAARIVRDLALALEHAHGRGVLHRDLKPANVVVDRASGAPLLTDFGLAKRVEGSQALTRTGDLLGTPAFMSPEQATGKHDLVGPRSDLFSLGGTLYALLTGHAPFEGGSLVAVIAAVVASEPKPLSAFRHDVPDALEAILFKSLARDPEDRYADAAALAADLDRFLGGGEVLAPSPPRGGGASRWIARHPGAVLALLGVLAVLVGGLAIALITSTPRGEEEPPTTVEEDSGEGDGSEPVVDPPPQPVAEPVWREAKPPSSPPARWSHSLTWDPVRQVVLLFGGQDGRQTFDDLWAWNGSTWTQLNSTGPSPAPRYSHAAAFDTANGRLLVYGGSRHDAASAAHADQWEWNGESWSKSAMAPMPGTISWHSMTSAGDELFLFGGRNRAGRLLKDVWRWNGRTWIPSTPGPPAQTQHAAAWEPERQVYVVYGGILAAGRTDKLWEWDGERWKEHAAPGPGAREAPLAYDGQGLRLISGHSADQPLLSDWQWDGRDWVEAEDPLPVPRSWHAAAWDPIRRALVVFGGRTKGAVLADTWVRATR